MHMITDILKIEKLISPLIFIIGGFMLGLIFERIIIREIRKLSAKTKRDTGISCQAWGEADGV